MFRLDLCSLGSAWIIWIAPLFIALFYASIFHIDWRSITPPIQH